MTNSFTNRIDTLIERIEREKDLRSDDHMDDLSRSLYEMGAELAALDDLGLTLAADALEISPDAVRSMARDYAPPVWVRI